MNTKDKKLKIWSGVLQEQNLCEDLEKISSIQSNSDETENDAKKRGIETYFHKNAPNTKETISKNHLNIASISKKKIDDQDDKKMEIKDRLGSRVAFDENKSRKHVKVSEFDLDEAVVKEIARCLKEPNLEVISRCVRVLGKKKSLDLLYATQDIIDNGGMLTADGKRYRTPGGIYLQLVKVDETILKCQRSQILIKELYQKKRKNQIKRLFNEIFMFKKNLITISYYILKVKKKAKA
jgi:phosphorylated adapter RNA export protein